MQKLQLVKLRIWFIKSELPIKNLVNTNKIVCFVQQSFIFPEWHNNKKYWQNFRAILNKKKFYFEQKKNRKNEFKCKFFLILFHHNFWTILLYMKYTIDSLSTIHKQYLIPTF